MSEGGPPPSVAEQLVTSYDNAELLRHVPGHELPFPPELRSALNELRELLFPGFSSRLGELRDMLFPGFTTEATYSRASLTALVELRLTQVRVRLSKQIYRGLHHGCPTEGGDCGSCETEAARITMGLMEALPQIRALLITDVKAAYDGDPAASGPDEVAFSYPGVWAMCVYRIAHRLWELGAPIVPRIMTELAHSETGIDIHPAASIGESFFIDHGTGVVVGETTTIGARVRIYQGVTLGALSLPTGAARELANKKRHPTIEDDVIIYANATILGGQTVIGKGAIIGGNCWITSSVRPGERRSV